MGGVIAAAYAAGKTPAELEALALHYANPMQLMRLMDPNPFRRGFLQGRRVRDFIEKIIGPERTFADIPIRLALTAVDLLRGDLVVLQEGRLTDAVMATSAVPGLWPPVPRGEAHLVDGGLLNNLPVDIARSLGADIVIAVHVAPRFPREQPVTLDVPFLPEFGDHFYQSVLILSDALTRHQLEETRPEVFIHPEMPDSIWLLGFDRAAEAIGAGERAAAIALPKIHRQIASFRKAAPQL
jgi:NTE family protein